MIKTLKTMLAKGCVALFAAVFVAWAVGGVDAGQPEWVQSVRKIAQSRGRPGSADESDVVKSLRQAAEQGEANAQFLLGGAYYLGRGVPQDHKEAAKWLRLAAEQGQVQAQFSLGGAHYFGRGVPQDHKEAAKWLRLAAEQGQAEAQALMGAMYALGQSVPQNHREAYVWFSIAAATGLATEDAQEKAVKTRDVFAAKLPAADLSAAQADAARIYADIQRKQEENEGE